MFVVSVCGGVCGGLSIGVCVCADAFVAAGDDDDAAKREPILKCIYAIYVVMYIHRCHTFKAYVYMYEIFDDDEHTRESTQNGLFVCIYAYVWYIHMHHIHV